MSTNKVYVIGVGLTQFLKPRGKVSYTELGLQAAVKALVDCNLTYDAIEQAYCGYIYGDSTCGQRVLYQLGMTQIPIVNVNNNCSTGSTVLWMGRNAIRGGSADCVLCVGWEEMEAGTAPNYGRGILIVGPLKNKFPKHTSPLGKSYEVMSETRGFDTGPLTAQIFGNAGIEYMEKYGAKPEHFAEIARINHAHSVNNPYSQFHDVYTLEQILASPTQHKFLTKLQCCPTSDGAAAVVICSQKFLDQHPHLKSQAIEIAGQAMATDDVALLGGSAIELVGAEMTRRAANMVYKESGIGVKDVQVVECHDCFSANEMVCLDALGLAEKGKAHELVANGDITFGGKYVVNPSGGLISKGHPIGATGLAQASELVWHLRGWATNRAKPHTRHCLQHNVGLGGAVVVTMYHRTDDSEAPSPEQSQKSEGKVDDGRKWAGYNPAVEARWISETDLERVRSKLKGSRKMAEGRKAFKGDQARL